MARTLLSSLLLATLCLAPSSLASLDRRQAETAALSALTSGPVAYVGYTASCTTSCAAMTSAANSCTEDTCACAASAQTVTCMNCVLGEATTAQGTTVTNGFTSYAQTCVDEGYLAAVPALAQAAAVASSSSSSVRSSSSASSSSASRTSSAAAAGSTAGYAAFSDWVTAVGTAVCTTECAPALNAFSACTATDTCICTATNFAYGQTCEDCLNLNEDGYWTTANLRQIAQLWNTAGSACGISVTTTGAAAATSSARSATATGSSSPVSNTLDPNTDTGVPRQSYYAPTTTESSSTRAQRASGTTAAGGTSAGERQVGAGGLVGWVVGAVGVAVLAL